MDISKQILKKNYAINLAINKFYNNSLFDSDFNIMSAKEMLEDEDIKSAIKSIRLPISSRIVTIKEKGVENSEIAKSILDRFSEIDFRKVIDNIIDGVFIGYNIQEIIWNDNFTIKEIKPKPVEWFYPQQNPETYEFEWYFNAITNGGKLQFGKFLIATNNQCEEFPFGYSELKSLWKIYKLKKSALSAVDSIVTKYGGVITWFTYNAEATSESDLTNMIDGASEIGDGTIIPVPVAPGGGGGYNKDFGFVPLSDLSTDVHKQVLEFCEKSILKYILGGTLTQDIGNVGSYGAAEVQNEVRNEYINSYETFIEKTLKQLIVIDSALYGYDYNKFDFYLELKENIIEKEAVKKVKIENINLLSVNYDLDVEYVANLLGIPIEYIKKKGTMPQFSQGYFGSNPIYTYTSTTDCLLKDNK